MQGKVQAEKAWLYDRRVRLLPLMIVLFVVGVGAAAAGPSLKPPVIHEVFASASCPKNPQSTLELEACAEKAILLTDAQINRRVAVIFRLLAADSARESFGAGERAWLRYRRASCAAQASKYAGGSAQPVEYGTCLVSRNRMHLRELATLMATLGQH